MRRSLLTGTICCLMMAAEAQTDNFRQAYDAFQQQAETQYENFRDEANRQYAEFVKRAWEEYRVLPAIPKPKEKEVPPVVIKEEKRKRQQPIEDKQLPIEQTIVPPTPQPQPAPVAPIRELPQPVAEQWQTFTVYGTEMRVRFGDAERFRLPQLTEQAVGEAWLRLSGEAYNNLLRDCLTLRMERHLGDWAYLQMLCQMAEACLGKGNEATLLTAYAYCQSGYQMRLGMANGRLRLLYASEHTIFDKSYFLQDGTRYYVYGDEAERMQLCAVGYPQERPLSLWITEEQQLAVSKTKLRTLTAKRYPAVTATVSVNRNMVDFADSYPTSCVGDDFMTRWAMYADTPMEQTIRNSLYPALRKAIAGLDEREAVERLLNWVQTAFVYEYDDKVWGGDRAFFADETLYYPYCDCEDRSILLSRLVRDLLGLKVVLVYYPGHLATAIRFTETVKGDYLLVDGDRYTVCDPTYINASAGMTMPGMDNSQAKVIVLR